jgi:hypothetical protein
MVREAASARLVQDFGHPSDPSGALAAAAPSDPDASAAPPKRGRGRPPGSRNKNRKPPAEPGGADLATLTGD